MMNYTLGTNNFIRVKETTNGNMKHMTVDYSCGEIENYGSIKEEYINILESIDEEIFILFSGGADSEAVVEAAKDSNAKFTAVTMRYTMDGIYLNDHDYVVAKEYCEKHRIAHKVFDLNMDWFFGEGNYIPFSTKYQCNSPQLCCHLWLLNELDGFCIMGGDLLNADLVENKILNYGYKYTCYDRYFHLNNKKGISNLGYYSPEVMIATMKLYHVLKKKCGYSNIKEYDAKHTMYILGGFNVSKSHKFTGFEGVKHYYSDKYNEPIHKRTFDTLFRYPIEKRVSEPDEIIVTYPEQILKILGE